MLLVVPAIVYALLLLGIVMSSGHWEENFQYLITFATVGGVLLAAALFVVDVVVCLGVIVAAARASRGVIPWTSSALRVAEVFLVPCLLWLLSWLVLELAMRM